MLSEVGCTDTNTIGEAAVVERDPGGLAADFLAAIVESSDDAILGKDLDGTILSWNTAAERLYGYTAAEAIGRPVSMLLPADRPHELEEILARVRAGERVVHFETRRLRRDGSEVDVSVTVSPIADRDGRVVGASSIARDIGARQRAAEEYRRLFERHPSPMWIFDVETLRFLAVNEAAVAVYGWTRRGVPRDDDRRHPPGGGPRAAHARRRSRGGTAADGRVAAPAPGRVGARDRRLLEPGGVRGAQRAASCSRRTSPSSAASSSSLRRRRRSRRSARSPPASPTTSTTSSWSFARAPRCC